MGFIAKWLRILLSSIKHRDATLGFGLEENDSVQCDIFGACVLLKCLFSFIEINDIKEAASNPATSLEKITFKMSKQLELLYLYAYVQDFLHNQDQF